MSADFRQRWANAQSEKKTMEAEKQTSQATITQLREEIQVLTADLNAQIMSLRSDKEAAEKALADEKASRFLDSTTDQDSVVVSSMFASYCAAPMTPCSQTTLRSERDQLLIEKESWIKSSSNAGEGATSDAITEEARRQWETEKAELIKARDEAASQLKVSHCALTTLACTNAYLQSGCNRASRESEGRCEEHQISKRMFVCIIAS